MYFTIRRIYKDFVLEDEEGLKKFYQRCSGRQKVACWIVLMCTIAIVILNLFIIQDFSPITNLVLLSIFMVAIAVFNSNIKRIERVTAKYPKTFILILGIMIFCCSAAAAMAIVLLMKLMKMS